MNVTRMCCHFFQFRAYVLYVLYVLYFVNGYQKRLKLSTKSLQFHSIRDLTAHTAQRSHTAQNDYFGQHIAIT